ncbi:UNVERIFIED_CONTAM: hypothetical protein GTU68_011170 [Idotea baltica]|nr:hypothetical protein [Idotea baltica]
MARSLSCLTNAVRASPRPHSPRCSKALGQRRSLQ